VTPLAATLAGLAAADPYCNPVAGAPTGERWTCVQELLDDPAVLRSWFDELGAESHGAPDVAASYLASWIGGIVLDPLGWALGVERRAWPIDPRALWIHRHDGGWFDGFAVAAPTLRVLPDDVAVGQPDVTTVPDLSALRALVAGEAVAVLVPLFALVRTFAPFGIRGMWGQVADSLGSGAALAALRRGTPERSRPAFDEAMQLVDDLVTAGAGRITRPTPSEITCSFGPTTVTRKGTCCLWYKTTDDTAPIAERYCLSCPIQPDPEQRERWVAWLDSQHPARVQGTSDGEHLSP
jgi:hypothetical protein